MIALAYFAVLNFLWSEPQPEWAAALTETPAGFGPTILEREVWDDLNQRDAWNILIKQADNLRNQPIPEQSDELYLDFSKTGNRTRWQRVAGKRRSRVRIFALAECLENKGRFILPLSDIIQALCKERTWLMPAHDRGLANFNGKSIDIDLASASLGWDLATVIHILGDKLPAETKVLIEQNVRKRIMDPFMAMARGERKANWWMNGTNNWNAVCLAGVTGAGLTLARSKDERAALIHAALKFSRNFLKGFTSDGYCSEGVGYWNYGFGHFVLLSEAIHSATSGKLDLLSAPEVRAAALYGSRIEIFNRIYPSFADCSIRSQPNSRYMQFLSRRFKLGLNEYENKDTLVPTGNLYEILLLALSTRPFAEGKEIDSSELKSRDYFDKAGVLICRPAKDGTFAVAMKGGHNAEHHNHNDVGSYIVVVDNRAVLVDPGSEVYTARTFSGRRYDSKVLNSFGHPVPLVAGQLQSKGRAASGKVLRTEFTQEQDTFVIDMKAAYDVKELKTLTRSFVYSRAGNGALTVTDKVEFSAPSSFESALITFGGWRRDDNGTLFIYDADQAVEVEITCPIDYEIRPQVLDEDLTARTQPVRLGIVLNDPVLTAELKLRIAPVAVNASAAGQMVRNGSFEMGGWGWSIPNGGQCKISDERASSGKHSLKLTDNETNRGSNVSSAFIPLAETHPLRLKGKVFTVSGSGIGMYVKYFSSDRKPLNDANEQGHIAPAGVPESKLNEWSEFSFEFSPPEDTASIQIWIHSFNAAKVSAFIDDLEIVKVE